MDLWAPDVGEFFFSTLPFIYATAFCLDFFVVGPLVMRFVRKFNIAKYTPLIRVGVMAMILTCIAPIVETGFIPGAAQYAMALPRNYVAALLLQVFIAMPMGMMALTKYRNIKSGVVISK